MLGLTVRWSLVGAADGVEDELASYVAETSHAGGIGQLVLDAGRQPQRLRVGAVGLLVDTAQIEARAFILAETIEHFGEIERRTRVGGIQFVGSTQRALGGRHAARASLANAFGQERTRCIAVARLGDGRVKLA